MQIGDIYATAQITLVAATGDDPTHGLPGVSSHPRPRNKCEELGPVCLLPAPRIHGLKGVAQSKWATRGWTFQEFYRSRRRLIFTAHEAIYICSDGPRYEIVMPPTSSDFVNEKDKDAYWLEKWLSQEHARGKPYHMHDTRDAIYRAMAHLEAYSRRQLSYDSDALNAITGALDPLRNVGVYHIWGVPFVRGDIAAANPAYSLTGLTGDRNIFCCNPVLHRYITPMHPQISNDKLPDVASPDTIAVRRSRLSVLSKRDYWQHTRMSLLWYHNQPCRRRHDFPSWSPIGWVGEIDWYRYTLETHAYVVGHVCGAKFGTQSGTSELSSLIQNCVDVSNSLSPCLELRLQTANLKLVNAASHNGKHLLAGEAYSVSLSLNNDLEAEFTPNWDIVPALLDPTMLYKGALIHGTRPHSHLAFVLVLASRDDYWERVGIFEAPSKLGHLADLNPMAYLNTVDGVSWWDTVFEDYEVIQIR
jgi:hypothetical protein